METQNKTQNKLKKGFFRNSKWILKNIADFLSILHSQNNFILNFVLNIDISKRNSKRFFFAFRDCSYLTQNFPILSFVFSKAGVWPNQFRPKSIQPKIQKKSIPLSLITVIINQLENNKPRLIPYYIRHFATSKGSTERVRTMALIAFQYSPNRNHPIRVKPTQIVLSQFWIGINLIYTFLFNFTITA